MPQSHMHRHGAKFTFILGMIITLPTVALIINELFFCLKEYFIRLNVVFFTQEFDRD